MHDFHRSALEQTRKLSDDPVYSLFALSYERSLDPKSYVSSFLNPRGLFTSRKFTFSCSLFFLSPSPRSPPLPLISLPTALSNSPKRSSPNPAPPSLSGTAMLASNAPSPRSPKRARSTPPPSPSRSPILRSERRAGLVEARSGRYGGGGSRWSGSRTESWRDVRGSCWRLLRDRLDR
jgi:hypothetical protein